MDAAEVALRKRRCNRSVVGGISSIASALTVSVWGIAPPMLTTISALVGFVLLMYGVHVAWMIFYDREDDGSPT